MARNDLYSKRALSHLLGVTWRDLTELAERAGGAYESFDILAPGREKWRHLDDPRRPLKLVQRRILRRVLHLHPLRENMFGARRGASVHAHAALHAEQPVLVALDIRGCFPNTRHTDVFNAYVTQLRCSTDVASVLTKLTTLRRHLPQGAPTSPMLAHLVMVPLFDELQVLAEPAGVHLSFYVDDIALSGVGAPALIEPVVRLVQKYGYAVGTRKKTVMRASGRQQLVGLMVNDHVAVPRAYRDEVARRIIDLGRRTSVTDRELRSARGRIAYVRAHSPEHAAKLDALLEKVRPNADGVGHASGSVLTTPCNGRRCRASRGLKGPLSIGALSGACIELASTPEVAQGLARSVPTVLSNAPDVLAAIAGRPDIGDVAEQASRTLVKLSADDARSWLCLGSRLLDVETRKIVQPNADAPERLDPGRLREARDAFAKAGELAEIRPPPLPGRRAPP